MTLRPAPVLVAVVVTSLLTTQSARAECVLVTAKQVMEGKHYELVFSGTVVDIVPTTKAGSYQVTFDVDRVWKGSVAQRFDLYVWGGAEIPRFEVGDQHLALARRITPVERPRVGLGGTDIVAFTPAGCNDPGSLAPDFVRDLGPGQPPQ